MGRPRLALPAKLVVGMLSADTYLFDRTAAQLEERFGPIDYVSPVMPFSWSHFYDAELGTPVLRRFITHEHLVGQQDLVAVKLATNDLEQGLATAGRRCVNLDPGYLTLAKLVLATTKDNAHRLYLSDGVYAEVTLRYTAGRWQPWPWTYPDFASGDYLSLFAELRARYAKQLRPEGLG